MNDDLIRRSDATAHPFANGKYDRDNANGEFIKGFESYKEWLKDLPAVDLLTIVVEYLQRFNKWCTVRWCDECSMYDECKGSNYGYAIPQSTIALFKQWAQEHLEEVSDEVD